MLGVGAHESDGIGHARQCLDLTVLDRLQKGRADAQDAGDLGQLAAQPQPRRAQRRPDGLIGQRPFSPCVEPRFVLNRHGYNSTEPERY